MPLQFGVISTCKFFRLQIALALRVRAIFIVFEKYTRAHLHQIALEIMSLPKLNEGGWPSLDFMVLHELVKVTYNQSKLQAIIEYYDIK